MTTTTQVDLVINKLTKAQYQAIANPNPTELYFVTDDSGVTSAEIINALGYTPYNATNPNGYVTNASIGTGTLTITQGGTPKGTFNANGDTNVTIDLDAGGGTGTVDQVYDSTSANAQSGVAIAGVGFLTSSSLNGYATQSWVTSQGYTTNTGTVTSVNNVQPVNGNVTITIPTVPTNVSAFNNDAGYITSSALTGYATQTWVGQQGYLTSSSIANMQTTGNLVTSISSSSTDSQYPSAKCMYDIVGDIETLLQAV